MEDCGRHVIVLLPAYGKGFHCREYAPQEFPGRNPQAVVAEGLQPQNPKRLIFCVECVGDPVRAKQDRVAWL